MVQEQQLHREDFYVEVHCAEGYHGRAKALPCLHLSQPYKLTGCHKGIDIEHVHREKKEKTPIVTGPPGKYHLDLRLPEDILSQKSLKEQKAMFKQYGFNLKKSNEMGLVRPTRDLRNAQCQARQYPEVSALPKASVIIIFFNEALSTLLRNVMMVFNLTPEELLGEVLLVDDHSDLEELKLLPEHLERLKGIVPPEKVRLVHRDSHDGIVAARNLGAKEARFPVIVILDSHAEVTVGWLEPLLARIHEDRKRVVVPNIVAIDIHNLDFLGGNGAWPPVRGIFNWRLTFIGAAADMDSDLLEKDVDKKASVWRSPVMPGGLFAMDREYYWELGGYDPEIRYYGAEHVEMSFRIWMCGGTLEVNPCSNIGHIYREFDRFGVDRQLKSDIGKVLDRNDARVADVWMDEYKELFFKYRNMKKADLGPQMESRHQLREKLQCKSFEWFLKEVCRDLYIPDEDTEIGKFLSVHTSQCITGGHDSQGPVHFDSCNSNAGELQVEWTSRNYIQISPHVNHHLVCLRTQIMAQVPCNKGTKWKMEGKQLRSLDRKGSCLTRSPSGEALDLVNCKDVRLQQWLFQNPGTLSGPDKDLCVDNMQRSSGPPGLYGCHGGNTQRWQLDDQQRLRSGEGSAAICLGFDPSVSIASCAPDDVAFEWIRRTSNHKDTLGFQTFSPVVSPEKCLVAKGAVATLESCKGKERWWKFPYGPR